MAILFLLLFAFAQYARELRFLECTMANTLISPESTPCNCTKVAWLDQPDNRTDLPVHVHGKIYNEYIFQLNKEIHLFTPWMDSSKKKTMWHAAEEQEGKLQVPWHPPLCDHTHFYPEPMTDKA